MRYQAPKKQLIWKYQFLCIKIEFAYEVFYPMFWADIMSHRFVDKIVLIGVSHT